MKKNRMKSKYIVLAILVTGGLSIPVLAENTVLMDNVSAQVKGIMDQPSITLSTNSIDLEAGDNIPNWENYITEMLDSEGNAMTTISSNLVVDDSSMNSDADTTTIDNLAPGTYNVVYTVTDSVTGTKTAQETMVVNVTNPLPVILLSETDIDKVDGEDYSFDSYITAVDDSLFTIANSEVGIDTSSVDIDEDGTVSAGDQSGVVTYTVTDGAGQVGTATLNVTVGEETSVDTVAPVLTLTQSQIEVEAGSLAPDWTTYIDTVSDETATITEEDVTVDASNVSDGTNINAMARDIPYNVTYTVTDGTNTTDVILKVKVVEPEVVDTVAPVLTLTQSQIEVEAGSLAPDWTTYIDTVSDETATITEEDVTVDASNVSDGTNINATARDIPYNVTYTVTDGTNTTDAILKVKVVEPDTTAPVITLNQTDVEVSVGDEITTSEWRSYISTVEDDVDGTLNKFEVEVDDSLVDTVGNDDVIDVEPSAIPYIVTYKATDAAGNEGTATINVTVKEADTTAPVITLNQTDIEVEAGEKVTLLKWKSYIQSVEDNIDGVINDSEVTVDRTTVDSNEDNIIDAIPSETPYVVTYKVTDAAGNEGIATLNVIVKEAVSVDSPTITLTTNNITMSVGQSFTNSDFEGYISTINDDVDTLTVANVDINTSAIDSDNNKVVDNLAPGDYEVIYTVTDNDGNTGQATLTVTVSAAVDPEAPIITLSTSQVTLAKGDSVNWTDYLLGAESISGDDLTSSVTVNATSVDSDTDGIIDESLTPGDYDVIYSVTDPVRGTGKTGSATLKVTIIEGTPTDPISNLTITKSVADTIGTTRMFGLFKSGNNKVETGETLNYTIEITNGSTEDLYDVVVEDVIDSTDIARVDNIKVNGALTGGFEVTGNDLKLDILTAGSTTTITYDATVASTFVDVTPIDNTVNIIETSLGTIDVENQPTSSATLPKEGITSISDITISKSVTDTTGDSIVSPLETLEYTLEITNNTSSDISDVVVVDTPDIDDITSLSNVKLDGNTTGFTTSSNQITIDRIPSNSTVNVTYNALTTASFADSTPIENVVAVTETSAGTIVETDQPTSSVTIPKYEDITVDEAPVLTLKTEQITVNEDSIKTRSDWKSYIDQVSDNIDTLTIGDVTVDVTEVDINSDGTIDATARVEPYEVKYSVTDSDGNKTDAVLKVIVQAVNPEAPVIELDTTRIEVDANAVVTALDWKNHIVNVSDDVTPLTVDDVVIDATQVDSDVDETIDALPGLYEVIYSVEDEDTNTTDAILEVEVIAPTTLAPDLSIVKSVEDTTGDTGVLGGESGDGKAQNGETLKYQVEVTNNSSNVVEDVVVEDVIDADDTNGISNLVVDTTYSSNSIDQVIIDSIPAGDTVTITYDVEVSSLFTDATDISNTVNIMSTSEGNIDVTDQPTSTATISKDGDIYEDTEAPIITLKTYDVTYYKDDTVTESEWKSYIDSVSDNVSDIDVDDVSVATRAIDINQDDVIDVDTGQYSVMYTVSDEVGNIGRQILNVEVLEHNLEAPVINFNTDKVTVTQGDTVSLMDWKSYIDSIVDNNDTLTIGDVTVDVTVVDKNSDGIIDVNPGIYQIPYSVIDSEGNEATYYLTVEVIANLNAPVITLQKTNVIVTQEDTVTLEEWKSNIVSVVDPSGTVDVDDVVVDIASVDSNTDNIIDAVPSEVPYIVSYTVENDLGYSDEEDLSVTVKSKEESDGKPVINLHSDTITVTQGDTISNLDWKSYVDSIDDDKDSLTFADVDVDVSEVDTEPDGIIEVDPGTYQVIYNVTDSDGNTGETILTVIVVSDEVIDVEAPVINLFNDRITLEINSTIPTEEQFKDNIKSIEDDKDTLTKNNVNIDSSDLDMSQEGIYTVIYSATDSDNKIGTKNLTVKVVPAGTIPVINLKSNSITVSENETVNWTDYIIDVVDDVDTIDKSQVLVDASQVDADNDSKVDATISDTPYNVVYTVQDASGNIGRSVLKVTVEGETNGGDDLSAPEIALYDYEMTYTVGHSIPDYEDNIKSVTDNNDDMSSEDVTIDSSEVNMNKIGEYNVIYSAEDAAGNVGESTLVINIVDASSTLDSDPYINLKYDSINLYKDQSEPSWSKYIESAGDNQDDDLGKSDVIITDNVDTSKTGSYRVYYSLTDSDNNTTVEQINVKVTTANDDTLTNTSNTNFVAFALTVLTGLFLVINPKRKK